MKYLLYSVMLMGLALACEQQEVPIDNIEKIPEVHPSDKPFANVYRSLDGLWEGTFYVYRDTAPVDREQLELIPLDSSLLERSSLVRSDSLLVEQRYESITPYFQRVRIRDYYPQRDTTIESRGVNKVQNGAMWCVVRKPDETVIHRGKKQGAHTIIWYRNEEDPQKVEYFRETVRENTYRIIGYGYYQGDDISLSPPFWFYAEYQRKEL